MKGFSFAILALALFCFSMSFISCNCLCNANAIEIVELTDEYYSADDSTKFFILSKNFEFEFDEFDGIGWYLHKNLSKDFTRRNLLLANVEKGGLIHMQDNYYGPIIYHTKVQVIVNDSVYTSKEYSISSGNWSSTYDTDINYIETIYYSKDTDNGILRAIANTSNGDIIKCRFSGGNDKFEFILEESDRIAIVHSYELSQLIKRLNYKNEEIPGI